MTEEELNAERRRLASLAAELRDTAAKIGKAMSRQAAHSQEIAALTHAYTALCLVLRQKDVTPLDGLADALSEMRTTMPHIEPFGSELLGDLSARLSRIEADLRPRSTKTH